MPRRPAEGIALLLGFWIGLTLFLPLAAPPAFSSENESPGAPPSQRSAGEDPLRALEHDLAEAVNRHRAGQRLIALERDETLDAVARAHSRDIAPSLPGFGTAGQQRLARARVGGFSMAGENVGMTSQSDPNQRILHGWILSPVHRQNLDARPYNRTGVGIARAPDGTLYYTQLYLSFPVED